MNIMNNYVQMSDVAVVGQSLPSFSDNDLEDFQASEVAEARATRGADDVIWADTAQLHVTRLNGTKVEQGESIAPIDRQTLADDQAKQVLEVYREELKGWNGPMEEFAYAMAVLALRDEVLDRIEVVQNHAANHGVSDEAFAIANLADLIDATLGARIDENNRVIINDDSAVVHKTIGEDDGYAILDADAVAVYKTIAADAVAGYASESLAIERANVEQFRTDLFEAVQAELDEVTAEAKARPARLELNAKLKRSQNQPDWVRKQAVKARTEIQARIACLEFLAKASGENGWVTPRHELADADARTVSNRRGVTYALAYAALTGQPDAAAEVSKQLADAESQLTELDTTRKGRGKRAKTRKTVKVVQAAKPEPTPAEVAARKARSELLDEFGRAEKGQPHWVPRSKVKDRAEVQVRIAALRYLDKVSTGNGTSELREEIAKADARMLNLRSSKVSEGLAFAALTGKPGAAAEVAKQLEAITAQLASFDEKISKRKPRNRRKAKRS